MNDLMLLALLLDGPKHGYALKKQAGFISGQRAMHNNLVYPLLRRFVEQNWVTQKRATGQRGQQRQVYSLTALGRRELLRRVAEFDDSQARSPEAFHLRVGFFEVLDQPVRERVLQKRREFLEGRIRRLENLETRMALGQFGAEVVRFTRQQVRRELAWIDQIGGMSLASARAKTKRRRRK